MTDLPDATTPLGEADAFVAFAAILDGEVADADIAAFLRAMADRGETGVEIAAAALAMRMRMTHITAPPGAIDVCGTGGDGSHSLNVSTAVAIVVAACGVPVAKHGNRAASSRAGAADTLEALGLDLAITSERAERCLADLGISFLFAQQYHPALARIAPVRRAMGRRTIFNLLGPIANPANVTRQLIGIASPAHLAAYGEALTYLAPESAMLVSGDEPLDELSISGPSSAIRLGACGNRRERLTPADAGLSSHPVDALRGGDAKYNAAALHALLMGEPGAYRDAVLLNASAALQVAGRADNWINGVEEAREAIDNGLAKALLDCWIAYK